MSSCVGQKVKSLITTHMSDGIHCKKKCIFIDLLNITQASGYSFHNKKKVLLYCTPVLIIQGGAVINNSAF